MHTLCATILGHLPSFHQRIPQILPAAQVMKMFSAAKATTLVMTREEPAIARLLGTLKKLDDIDPKLN
jgi:hypothetical protein